MAPATMAILASARVEMQVDMMKCQAEAGLTSCFELWLVADGMQIIVGPESAAAEICLAFVCCLQNSRIAGRCWVGSLYAADFLRCM